MPKSIPATTTFPLLISRVELADGHTHGNLCMSNESGKNEEVAVEKNGEGELDNEAKGTQVFSKENSDTIDLDHGSNKEIKETSDIVNREEPESKVDMAKDKRNEPFIRVIRALSAKGNPKTTPKDNRIKDLPNGDCGDGIVNPFPKDEVADKYWAQRKRLFSKFDEGVKLDKESWYSVTPEAIAGHIAKRVSTMMRSQNDGSGMVILDAFCGVGGNGIGFALQEGVECVICVDIDREKLKMAANNASIYKVNPSKILFVEGNAIDVLRAYKNGSILKRLLKSSDEVDRAQNEIHKGYTISGYDALPDRIDSVFLSPPWGGMNYLQAGNSGYQLSTCIKIIGTNAANDEEGCNGVDLLAMSSKAAKDKNVIYFLPKNVNGFDIGKAAWNIGYRNGVELEQNLLNGKLKTVTVYFTEKPEAHS